MGPTVVRDIGNAVHVYHEDCSVRLQHYIGPRWPMLDAAERIIDEDWCFVDSVWDDVTEIDRRFNTDDTDVDTASESQQ